MKTLQNFITVITHLLFCAFSVFFTLDSHAQALEVRLWEHSNYQGGLYRLNVNDCMRDCSYANNQWKDDISSVEVPDGYVLTIYNGNGLQLVGNCPELYCVGWQEGWDNVNNAFSIKKLPAGWDAPANLPTGIYRFFNPYEGQYLMMGGRNMGEGEVGKNTNNYRQPDNSDNAYNFLLIRDEKTQDYTIVSLATGRNWRPQDSGKQHFSIKEGTPLEANHFSNADSWSNFAFQPVGTANIGVERKLFSIKTKGSDDFFLTLPCRDRGTTPTFEKGGKNTAQQWEIQLVEALPNLNQNLLQLITEKNEKTPNEKEMTLLEYLDEETTVTHKKMSIKVPFYAVNDSKYGFKKRMESHPIYILEREEFVVRKGSNKGWTINRRDREIEFLVSNTTSNTSGGSKSFNVGTSISFSNETEAGAIFAKTKSTITVGVTMGFNQSWHSSHTQSLTTTTKEWVSPCTKAAIYALATKITVKRADKNGNPIDEAPVAQWTYFDKNSVIYEAYPLHPDECSTLSDEEYQKKLSAWERKYGDKEENTVSSNTNPTSATNPPSNLTPSTIPNSTSTPASNIGGTYRIQVKANQRFFHADGGGDRLISTRYQVADDFTKFIFEPQKDGTFRIKVKATGRYFHADGGGDKLISTRYQVDDAFSRFFVEPQNDGTYRIKVKATNHYFHEDGNGDKLLSTRYQTTDNFARFILLKQ